ncbi:Membralin [Bienertia sinuspersici]
MASEGNPNPTPPLALLPNSSSVNGGGFKSKVEHFLYSGDKKHVFAGLVAITAVFAVLGSKQHSHQDYLEKADKARSARLSSSSAK